MSKVLGKIKGKEIVLDKTDGERALTLVGVIPDPGGEIRTIQLGVDIGFYNAGSILTSDGTSWTLVSSVGSSVGAVSDIVRPRIGSDVQIRWKDPDDTDTGVWKHTRLVRKYMSYPTSPEDGVVVTDSYVRNFYYKENVLHDVLPGGTEDGWCYRFYTYTEDGVYYTSDACRFQPIELTWRGLPSIVRAGLGPAVYMEGDLIEVTLNDGVTTMNFEVVGFNKATPVNSALTRSITFVALNGFHKSIDNDGIITNVDLTTSFDLPWGDYVLTTDTIVYDSRKVYYIKDGDGFAPVTLRIGQRIPENTYYEPNTVIDRKSKGGNRWSLSALRKWLNDVDPTSTWRFNSSGTNYDIQPILTLLPHEVTSAIATVKVTTALPEVDGVGSEETNDKIFLPSLTEVFNKSKPIIRYNPTEDVAPSETYVVTTDTVPDPNKEYLVRIGNRYYPVKVTEFDPEQTYYEQVPKTYYIDEGEGAYRACTTADFDNDGTSFKEGIIYYEQDVDAPAEGNYLPQFGDEELNSKIKYKSDESHQAVTWWLRTPERSSFSKVLCVTQSGSTNAGTVATSHSTLVFGFVVA